VCDEIAATQPWLLNFAGITTLSEAIAMLALADVVVSNDSGLMNIASALNRPIVGIYGPTDYKHTPPFSEVAKVVSLDLDCAPCQQRECPLGHHHCMRNLTADMVWASLQTMLQER
jgi:heptosyltransferase-2